ncbi:non-hydrolyzing UDP-N-acetylglucosamine 2-epimerase [Pseudomonas sp. TE50-2]|uniref:non-hydrolyzing UDP-N-acetylglucosamine 2-epimerase n=1 Tax=Pseudomonas sp. TE50-2 TaxID=3142707 RepID=UPI003467635D
MRILTVIGARPQFVKAAVVSRELAKHDAIEELLVHTGQHFDNGMSDIFFEQMAIPKPHYSLGISSLSHGAMTGRMLERLEQVMLDVAPDKVMVYGDTNSTLAGALAASKLHIPLVHVEAGLRSFDMRMPEEVNRILTDRVSQVLLCPTQVAVENLAKEGFASSGARIVQVGDVMHDAALYYTPRATRPSLLDMNNVKDGFALVTLHRAENTDDLARLRSLVEALNALHQETPVIVPLHPRTRRALAINGLQLNVHVLEPVGYFEMLWLLQHCSVVLTDSGGLQKEAYFFAKPCVTLRGTTEWVELVEAGVNVLLGDDFHSLSECLDKVRHINMQGLPALYGGGSAARKVVDQLLM